MVRNVSAMTLKDWLTAQDMTASEFAERIGRSPATVSRILRGVNRPDWKTCDAIMRVTKGEVAPNDFSEAA